MIGYNRGDVVLVSFVFSNERGIKRRPAMILSADRYHQKRQESIVAAITSNVSRLLIGDHRMKDWRECGLLYPSAVTGIIRTVKQDMISRKLGTVSANDLRGVQRKLREILEL